MRRLAQISLGWLLFGCASMAQPETPALVMEATPQSREELRQVVSAALGRADVALADAALTASSVLLIEPKPARDSAGGRLSGREFDKPETFRLLTDGERCILIHQRTGERYRLSHARCIAAE